jgi:hypothetical protein
VMMVMASTELDCDLCLLITGTQVPSSPDTPPPSRLPVGVLLPSVAASSPTSW